MSKILIIEDDKTIRDELIAAALAAGVEAQVVEAGPIAQGKAHEKCKPNTFDAVVVGGYFHEAHVQYGHQIVERIRLHDRKVIIVGTAGDPNRRQAFLQAGANAFVTRGTQNNPTLGLLTALDLLKDRDAPKAKRQTKRTKPTPDQQ